jgi:hypothetical protein
VQQKEKRKRKMISREAHVAQIVQLFTTVDRGSDGSDRVSLVYNTLTSRNPTSKPLLPTQLHASTAASSFPALSPPSQPLLSSCTRSPATPLRGNLQPPCLSISGTYDDPGKLPPSLSPSPCCRARPFTSPLHLAPCFTDPREPRHEGPLLQIKEIPPQPTQSCCCSRCALLPSIERVPRPTYSGRGGRSIIPTPTPTMVATAAARGEGRERNHSAAARARSGSTPSSSSERGEKKIRFGLSLFPLSHAVD